MQEQSPREIIQENGDIYQKKRPLYKQPLFWTSIISLGLVLLLSLIVAALLFVNLSLSEENAKYGSRMAYTYSYYDYKNENPDYYFGQQVTFRNGAKISVQSVKTDKNHLMSDDAVGSAVVVAVRVENTSDRSLLVSPYEFDLYDTEDNLYVLDGSTFDNTQIGTNLAPGKSISFNLVFDGEDNDEDTYVVTYEDARWVKRPSHQNKK